MTARMIGMTGFIALPGAGLAMGKGAGHGKPPAVTCPADGNVAAAIDAACPCSGMPGDAGPFAWRNHGQYVKCVVHYRNALRKAGCFTDDSVRRTVARCAARSTCGKHTVLCCTYDLGTCSDPTPGNGLKEGVCSNDATVACDVAADCTKSQAHIAHDADACTASHGVVVAGGGSVCSPCPPPPAP